MGRPRAAHAHRDRDDLIGANQRLLDDVAALSGLEQPVPQWIDAESLQATQQRSYQARVRTLEPEATQIYDRVKAAPPTESAAAALFGDYVHDSYAGFRPFDQLTIFGWDPVPGSWEGEGYLRWRRRYEGTDRRYTQRVEPEVPSTSIA